MIPQVIHKSLFIHHDLIENVYLLIIEVFRQRPSGQNDFPFAFRQIVKTEDSLFFTFKERFVFS